VSVASEPTVGDVFSSLAVCVDEDRSQQEERASQSTREARNVQRRLHADILHQVILVVGVPALECVGDLHHITHVTQLSISC